MGRKRKIPIADEEKENTVAASRQRGGAVSATASNSMMLHGPMYTIMSNVQLNETSHKKYVKELKQLYAKMDHDAFMFTFIKMIKTAMVADEGNEYAETTLLFCSKFVSSYDGEDTHPVLIDMCKWLLTTISRNPHIRFRICQFVNMILKALGQEAALDDAICDRILEYMLHRLHDTSPNVRVQAILAMQRLQVPDNPDDPVLRAYQFHLCSDPSSRVRQAVITCMGRNYHTIPYILDRLWDIDEKVRRHTYLHMSSYPVRSYKVSQRLTLLQQGLNDRSEAVRKVVVTIMLQQWIESYQKDLIALIAALKLDSSESEIDRFRKVTKQTLKELFKRQKKNDLIACVPLDEDGEMHRLVPYEKLSMEIALYWQSLTEFLQTELAEEHDLIVPELSTFCTYVENFCHLQKADMDKFELMEFQYKLLSLTEMLYTFDLGDEIGRGNLQKLLAYLLKTFRLDEKVIEMIVRCTENLITDQNARIQFIVEIVQDICGLNNKQNDLLHDRTLITELLATSSNADLNLKLSSLKVKILDLEEQEMNFVKQKDYMRAQQITEEKLTATEEYANLLQPLLENHPNADALNRPLQLRKTLKPECILKSLQIAFHMVVSPKVRSLNPSILKLYNDFICRHLASNQIAIRDWALKCGTACSMLYEVLAKDVFEELYSQFFKNHNIRIWETSITCIFELLDRYGLDNFAKQEDQNKTKKSGRQLYNTLEFLDSEDDSNVLSAGQGVDVIYMMSHFLDTCDDTCIVSAIIVGFCRLILRGYIKSSDIIEKLLLRYFNPSTDANINQILGVFLENLIQCKRHGLLQPCLLPMLTTVLSAPYENPLHEIRPETITRFIIDSTRQESSSITDGWIHNKIAETILQEMLNNLTNKDLCKLLAKELITLELSVTQNEQLKREMKETADKLITADLDPRTIKLIIDFKGLVDGTYNPAHKAAANDSEGEEDSNDETVNDNDTAIGQTARGKAAAVSEKVDEPTRQPPPQPPPDGTESVATLSEDIAADAATELASQPATSSEEMAPTVSDTRTVAEQAADGGIITKDISPSARVPTTYGRENRVGHRYLRKSLNSTRGQSDNEAADGPPRSPKIRIEARIDSDKKSEQPAREEHQVRNTRVRRNLRYAEKNNAAEEEAAEPTKDAAKGRNKRRANLPTLNVDVDDTESNSKTNSDAAVGQSQATTTRSASSPAKRQTKESSKQQTVEQSAPKTDKPEKAKEVQQEPAKAQPKESIKTRSKEQEKAKLPPPATRLLARAATRSAAKNNEVEELNTSDVVPPSPPAVMSPRTIVRRQRRAGGGDISVANLTETQRRATRSQSNQSAPNQDTDTTEDEAEDRTDTVNQQPTNTESTSVTKALTSARVNLKRTFCSTPKPTGAATADVVPYSPRLESPLLKRLRAETPAKKQLRPRRGNSSPPPSEPLKENATKENSTEVVGPTRRSERQRSTSLTIPEPEKNTEATRKSAGAKASASSDSNLTTNASSATRTRSATSVAVLTPADTAAQRTRSAKRTSVNADADAADKSSSATSVEADDASKSATRKAEDARTKSAPRANSESATDVTNKTRTRSATRSTADTTSVVRAKKHADTPSADDKDNSAPKEKRRKSNNNEDVSTPSPQRGGMMTRRRLSMSGGNLDDAGGDTSDNETASEVTQRRRSLRDRSATDAAKEASMAPPTSKPQQQASKIPVRASSSSIVKTRHAARNVSSSLVLAPKTVESNSSSGSGSSSTEEAMKTLGAVLLRKRALTTKVTRIHLAQRTKGNPVPMELARPTRLRAPASNLSTSNLRAKKL
ncbi:condensin complex subunit 3 isoform X2 [Zeugodacus cucurbitae]|uniref:condensin complex subunit 3 isoform X2 n=1 Tax=Zeugodacus cucurbitae TaxID=28588 RepID=UPI0023D937CD|nr:condensin complex subunit 3 isoform X2 [Zeugodacus cucurbitae]